MKRNSSKVIILAYFAFTIVYFSTCALFFDSDVPEGKNIIVTLLHSLGNVLYWLTKVLTYIIIVLVTSVLGMVIRKKHRKDFLVFRAITLGSLALLLFLLVISFLE